MKTHYFMSYSRQDAGDFVLELHDALEAGPPPIPMWIDRRDIKPGDDWDCQIVDAIKICNGLIFLMTKDSVDPQSVCRAEWTRALKYKKPIIPLLLLPGIEVPLQLENIQYIDFHKDFDAALAKLRDHLAWLKTPKGILHQLKYRLTSAKRDLQRAPSETTQWRIEDEIKILRKHVTQQQSIVNNPQKAVKHVKESISRRIDRERQSKKSSKTISVKAKFINPPPAIAPSHFQNRNTETKLIADFLKNQTMRILTIRGRGGTGKTVLVCRILKNLEKGFLPDNLGKWHIDGIIYLRASGSKHISFLNLYSDLCYFLPAATARQLDKLHKNPHSKTQDITAKLLEKLSDKKIILLLDNFQEIVDNKTQHITEIELKEALEILLKAPQHYIKVIITTRIVPSDLAKLQPAFQSQLNLDDGLPSPYAENILRTMDIDGKIGLKDAPEELLKTARNLTRGYPRALEALFAILAADRDTSLEEILDHTQNLLPEDVMAVLVGEAFSRLDPILQRIMEALAVYGIPVTPVALDYLLQPHLIGLKSAPLLKHLVNMQFVHKESGRYYLHPVDRAYSLSRIPTGSKNDWKNGKEKFLYTQYALRHRGAGYFKQIRKPRGEWKTRDDLAPQLAEFELRFAGEEYRAAAKILTEITNKYLNLWGYYQLSAKLHERLLEKIQTPCLKRKILGVLGLSYFRMGKYLKAKKCFEQELEINEKLDDNINMGKSYGNIGACYEHLKQINRAMVYYHRTLKIARNAKIRRWEAVILCNLGNCYSYLGKVEKSIEYLQNSLAIDRELKDRENENISLGNLGMRYATLGNSRKAMDYYNQALKIAREIGSKRGEAFIYFSIGNLLTDKGYLDKACIKFQKAIRIADDIGLGYIQNDGRLALARNYLFKGDLPLAEATLRDTSHYEEPSGKTTRFLLIGLVALRKKDRQAAKDAFTTARQSANELLEHGEADETYSLLLELGFIFCGLAITRAPSNVSRAIDAFQAARTIYKDAGVTKGPYSEFQIIEDADEKGVLADLKEIIPGLSTGRHSLNGL